jgi:hypothetical protein
MRNSLESSAALCRMLTTALGMAAIGSLVLFAGCGGGGGGGGGGGQTVNVTGTVLSVTTNAAVSGGSVKIGGQSATTGTDGTFTVANAPLNATSATITATGLATDTLAIKLAKPGASGTDSLGNIYLADAATTSPYTAVVTGTVVTQITNASGQLTNQPVGGATVTISGQVTTTATDGTFTISNLPVGLGSDPNVPIGTITATGFNPKSIIASFPLVSGSNPLGTLPLGAPISGTVPGQPYTLTGQVQHGGKPAPGVQVFVEVAGTTTFLGPSAQTDANGNYYFWLVPGTYNLVAEVGGSSQASLSGVVVGATNTITTAPAITY